MLKIENTEVLGWEHAIHGMRNPMNRLRNAGTDHRKFMRMITVYVDLTGPLYWWKEFDTYKVGTVANSCSTMHKIAAKEFTLEDFSYEHLIDKEVFAYPLGGGWRGLSPIEILNATIELLNNARKYYLSMEKQKVPKASEKAKEIWWQMIQLLPSSYNQTRNVMMNYEVLANIYKSRKDHKLDEWRTFCDWIEGLPYSELITGSSLKDIPISNEIMEEAMVCIDLMAEIRKLSFWKRENFWRELYEKRILDEIVEPINQKIIIDQFAARIPHTDQAITHEKEHSTMTINEYQALALRTESRITTDPVPYIRVLEGLMGLNGEAGEAIDLMKKVLFQGHEFDREHMAKELGDIAWYLAVSADAIGYDLESILQMNVDKLRTRYPDGFSTEQSLHRSANDI